MSDFGPNNYFDLSAFEHRRLFDGCASVWQALNNIESYLISYKLGSISSAIQQYAYFVNPESITIGEGTTVEPGAYIRGPCIIGKNCHIRHGAYIRGHVIVGDNCVVGHTTEIKHSILLDHAHAAHFAYLGDSIIGSYVNLGAGVKCANLKLNGEEVLVHHKGDCQKTGLRKFGAIVGDFSQIGCNTVLNPGTLLGKQVHCHPCMSVFGVVNAKSILKNRAHLS